MTASSPTLLARVMDAIGENLAAVLNVAGTAQLFGGTVPADWDVPAGPAARTTRLYFPGEPVPTGGPYPLAIIRIEDESLEEFTTVRSHSLDWSVEVQFDLDPLTEPDAHPTVRDIHTNLIGQIKDRLDLDANRLLPLVGFGTTVMDNGYAGGGAKLTPVAVDAEGPAGPAVLSFTLQYHLTYRHAPADSRTPA